MTDNTSLLTQPIFEITKRSHHFQVKYLTPGAKSIADSFTRGLISYKLVPIGGVITKLPDKVYAASDANRSGTRYHINSWLDFVRHLENSGVGPSAVRMIEQPLKPAPAVQWEMFDHLSSRDYQDGFINYGVQKTPISKLIQLQTGKGKSFIAMKIAMLLGARVALVIKPSFISKWIIDFEKTFKLDKKKDVCVIQGSKSLLAAIELAKRGEFNFKVVLISITTLQAWITTFEAIGAQGLKEMGYDVTPDEFYEHLGIGLKIIDEVHLFFHFCFKSDLYTHVPQSVCLTATLTHKDAFMRKMYALMFPIQDRCKELEYDKYCNIHSVHFEFKDLSLVKTNMRGNPLFSYVAVENSILKNKVMLQNYLEMLRYNISISFGECKRPKKKLLIFASTIDMITKMIAHVKKLYPFLSVLPYYTDMPFDNVMTADICISTLGSAGTALDIPDLTHVILTNSVDSEQSNLQSIGRLRKLPDGFTPEFYYWVAANVPSSMRYHMNKTRLLAGRALNQIYIPYRASYI